MTLCQTKGVTALAIIVIIIQDYKESTEILNTISGLL